MGLANKYKDWFAWEFKEEEFEEKKLGTDKKGDKLESI